MTQHTCILTDTTTDGSPVPACPACNFQIKFGVVIKKMRELHPTTCSCVRCCPWSPMRTTGGGMPQQVMWMSLADDEDPPEGWR